MAFGRSTGSRDRLCPDLDLRWVTSFCLLGIKINVLDLNASGEFNLESKMGEINGVLQQYGRRQLSIVGKVTVVKTLVIPKIIHILSVFPTPSKRYLKVLNEKISLSFFGIIKRVK